MSVSYEMTDSHCHTSDVWYEPIESLVFHMQSAGVASAVLVQVTAQFDNSYQQSCARSDPARFASVVLVDSRREDACDELERLASEGAVGVRLTSADRSPGSDPLAIWRCAERLELAVSLSGIRRLPPGRKDEDPIAVFCEVIDNVPRLRIVLEHQGSYERDANEHDVRLREAAFALSRYPNVFMKLGGVGEIALRARPFEKVRTFAPPVPPYHAMAYDAFGADRLMWGSDYPPVSGREGYVGCLESCREYLPELGDEELAKIFGGTARRVFFRSRAGD